jgi:Ca2+-dependent lipid-binding protein
LIKGVVCVEVVKATNLPVFENGITHSFTGDVASYVKIEGPDAVPSVTKSIENNLQPVWNELFYFLVDEMDRNHVIKANVFQKYDQIERKIGS